MTKGLSEIGKPQYKFHSGQLEPYHALLRIPFDPILGASTYVVLLTHVSQSEFSESDIRTFSPLAKLIFEHNPTLSEV